LKLLPELLLLPLHARLALVGLGQRLLELVDPGLRAPDP